MAAITGCTAKKVLVGGPVDAYVITTPATADSADTIDFTSAAAAGVAFAKVYAPGTAGTGWDATTGDVVTATIAAAATTIVVDAAGATTNHVYEILVFGKLAQSTGGSA